MWQHVKLSEQIRPWDTLACCWDVRQPTNKQTTRLSLSLPLSLHICHCLCLSVYIWRNLREWHKSVQHTNLSKCQSAPSLYVMSGEIVYFQFVVHPLTQNVVSIFIFYVVWVSNSSFFLIWMCACMCVCVSVCVLLWSSVRCLTSQQHTNVSHGQTCLDNRNCCHAEIGVKVQTCYLTHSILTLGQPPYH